MSKKRDRGGLTRYVDHSSTEPRVGSSNLSGRAALSENSPKVAYSQALAAGLSRIGASQLIALDAAVTAEIARRTRAVAAGRISPSEGRRQVRAVTRGAA